MSDDHGEEGEGEAAPVSQDAVRRGADLLGSLTGAAVSLVGGPAGAFLGVGVTWAASQILERVGLRSRDRAIAALLEAGREDERRTAAGEPRRADGFFDARSGRPSIADEVLEGVLLQATNAFEEAKVPYLGRLYAGIAHDDNVSAAHAHFLVGLAGALTYRQFVALAVLSDPGRIVAPVGTGADVRLPRAFERDVMMELDDLGARGLAGAMGEDGQVLDPSTIGAMGNVSARPLANLMLTPPGARLARLLGVQQVPRADRDAWMDAAAG